MLPASAARALTPTAVATYSPYAPAVRTAPGFAVIPVAGATCATASFVVAASGAFRCSVRDRIHDPCYLNPTASTPAAPVVD